MTKSVRLVVVEDGEYSDAKILAKQLSEYLEGWQLEGGVHNVARRDGIGSLIIDAAYTIGSLPDHYFQGIGGGPGPIGVHEMAERLVETGQFDGPVPQQHVSQNIEHSPIHNAWQAGRDHLLPEDFPKSEVDVYSDYLLNTAPAYGQVGGVHDILEASNGNTHAVEREDAEAAKALVEDIEGIDIMTPGAVATASLQQAIESGDVGVDDCILLNISGGGTERLKEEIETRTVQPWLRVSKQNGAKAVFDALAEER